VIFALLQISASEPEMEEPVAQILNLCTFAGHHLVDISAIAKHLSQSGCRLQI
jgi:hypothetical protein